MNKIKAVLFDMDGVIFDTEREYLQEWNKIFEKYGYEMKKEIYVSVMGRGRKKVKEIFKEKFGNNLPIEEMYIEKDKMLKEAIENNKVPLKQGALELLEFLKKKGYKTALATSAKKDRVKSQVTHAKINNLFDAIVCADDIVNSKPDPEIFLKAAEKVNIKPENCVVIEDSEAGIRAAFNAGMIAFHVKDLKEADENIMKYCDKNFENLIEIKKYIENML